jgi:hypothetical protein
VRYLAGEDHGFIDLRIGREAARAEFVAVDTVENRNYNAFVKVAFDIEKRAGGAYFQTRAG